MKNLLRSLSIKNKIIMIILSFTFFSLITGFLIVVVYDFITFRNDMINRTNLVAKVVGDYSVSALAFMDEEESSRILKKLDALPNITFAALYDSGGRLFAYYDAAGGDEFPPAMVDEDSSDFSEGALHVYREIIYKGDDYGTIYLRASIEPLVAKTLDHFSTLGLIALFLVVVTFAFAVRFQRLISSPILYLVDAVRSVSEAGDYSVRVESQGDDEIGQLCDAFNEMITQIQKRKMERDKAEYALKKNETRFRNMIEQANDPIFVIRDGRFLFVNPKFVEYFEYTPEETRERGFNLMRLVGQESRENIINIFIRRSRGGSIEQQHDMKGISKSGKVYDFEISFSVISWDEGTAILGTLRDITARKKAIEETNRKQEEVNHLRHYLQNIIDSMPSVLVGVNQDGKITEWNLQAEQSVGMSKGMAQGRDITEVFPHLGNIRERVSVAIKERETQKSERIVTNKDDEMRYNDIMVYPLIADGVDGAVIRIDDVTSRVRFETMMVQTEKMMSVGGLAAGMAHEINNPLGGILMSAQNINRRLSPDIEKNIEAARECGTTIGIIRAYLEKRDLIRMLDGIQEMGERAARIVANMLSFSRRSEQKKMPVDMPELVNKTVELAANDYDLKKKYDFRHIEIVRDYDEDVPTVWCLATEIEQVLLNLVKNAAQAMIEVENRKEEPRITLRVKHVDGTVRIDVEDNGPGMSEEDAKRVFEPFFTTKKVGEGTGLGLSVSYFIITDNHKGEMSVQSTPGRGTVFSISLPVDGE